MKIYITTRPDGQVIMWGESRPEVLGKNIIHHVEVSDSDMAKLRSNWPMRVKRGICEFEGEPPRDRERGQKIQELKERAAQAIDSVEVTKIIRDILKII